ncbi:unnamed protein product [Oikopleura dioica]|uniref:Uncharacterized protein n=1 Tax=Oikopleura dioica TaxID=34765 RepID=E4X2I4_OIKDI|nr:unnamed protein product [Oikopleura dioica]
MARSDEECAVIHSTSGAYLAKNCGIKRTFFCQYEAPLRGCQKFKFATVFTELGDFAGIYERGMRSQMYIYRCLN